MEKKKKKIVINSKPIDIPVDVSGSEPVTDVTTEEPRKQYGYLKEHDDNARAKRALLIGATPLLVGMLAGNTGDAAEIAGKALIDEDQRALKEDSDLLSYLRKRKEKADSNQGLKKRFQFPSFQDEQGNIKIATGDTFTGAIEPTKFTKGFSPFMGKDPRTGEIARVTKGSRGDKMVDVEREDGLKNKFNVKQEKDLKGLQKSFMADKLVQASRKAVSSSNRAIELLTAGNPIADEGIKTIFPRMFGEVGNLAANEQERFSGSPELMRRIDRVATKVRAGILTEEDRSDLLEVARMMAAYDKRELQGLASEYAKSESKISGVDRKDAREALRPGSSNRKFDQKAIKRIRKKSIEGSVREIEINGRKVKYRKTSKGWQKI